MPVDQMTYIPLWQLILAGAVQVGTFIWLMATLSNRVTVLEKTSVSREQILERVVKVETIAETMGETVDRLEEKLDRLLEPRRNR